MPREALLNELGLLSRRELELTLAGLGPAEREHVRRLIGKARPPRPATPPSFETLAGLSPWLLKAIDRSKSPEGGASRMSPAARAVLGRALEKLAAGKAPQRPAGAPASPWLARIRAMRKPRQQVA
jgi:hypothetical protein